jgi:hypothetical protein
MLLFMCVLSTTAFAQRDAGGSSGGVPPQPCPDHFTRNNGDGTCGGEAQIRAYYTTLPTVAPVLQSILYNGAPLYDNVPVVGDMSNYATTGYVSFCLPTSNIPPAIKLTLIINYTGSTQPDCVIEGTD